MDQPGFVCAFADGMQHLARRGAGEGQLVLAPAPKPSGRFYGPAGGGRRAGQAGPNVVRSGEASKPLVEAAHSSAGAIAGGTFARVGGGKSLSGEVGNPRRSEC